MMASIRNLNAAREILYSLVIVVIKFGIQGFKGTRAYHDLNTLIKAARCYSDGYVGEWNEWGNTIEHGTRV
jgi:hypothetical protein